MCLTIISLTHLLTLAHGFYGKGFADSRQSYKAYKRHSILDRQIKCMHAKLYKDDGPKMRRQFRGRGNGLKERDEFC